MKLTVRDIFEKKSELIENDIEIMAWVKNLRDSKNIVFIELSDGTCFKPIQIVVDKELENFEEVRKFNLYTVLEFLEN